MKSAKAILNRAGVLFAIVLAGCGGGGGGATSVDGTPQLGSAASTYISATIASGDNVIPVTVDRGPRGTSVSTPFVSVTLCEPENPSKCQTIDHIIVDTGSTGLRIIASELKLSLPVDTNDDGALAECMQFADGYTWGSVRRANVQLAGQEAQSVAMQVIGDPAYPVAPTSCSSMGGFAENSVATFGANGIIGVGHGLQDYGPYATRGLPGAYYRCPTSTSCAVAAVSLEEQVLNPVALLERHNNGVVLQLPSVPETGSTPVQGALVLGIETAANNAPSAASVLNVNPNTFLMSTVYGGTTRPVSLIDSGTNVIMFGARDFPVCGSFAVGFYCPTETAQLSATLVSSSAVTSPVNFEVANAVSLISRNGYAAFRNLGAPSYDTTTFIWGAPFFFGRSVWTVFEGAETTVGTGPFVAFKSL